MRGLVQLFLFVSMWVITSLLNALQHVSYDGLKNRKKKVINNSKMMDDTNFLIPLECNQERIFQLHNDEVQWFLKNLVDEKKDNHFLYRYAGLPEKVKIN